MAATIVYDVLRRRKHVYVGMTPAQAVRNAYMRYGLKDPNESSYDDHMPVFMVEAHPMQPNGKRILYQLGYFSAIA